MSEEVIAECSCENLRLMSLKVKTKEREEISNDSGFCFLHWAKYLLIKVLRWNKKSMKDECNAVLLLFSSRINQWFH